MVNKLKTINLRLSKSRIFYKKSTNGMLWIFLALFIWFIFEMICFCGLKLFKKFILSDNCFILFAKIFILMHVGSKMQYIIYARITGYGGNILFAAHGNREVAPTC